MLPDSVSTQSAPTTPLVKTDCGEAEIDGEESPTPLIEMKTPATATKTLAVETPTLPITTPTLPIKTPTSPIETKTPLIETPTLAIETLTPAIETPTPTFETQGPAVETKTLAVETKTPSKMAKPAIIDYQSRSEASSNKTTGPFHIQRPSQPPRQRLHPRLPPHLAHLDPSVKKEGGQAPGPSETSPPLPFSPRGGRGGYQKQNKKQKDPEREAYKEEYVARIKKSMEEFEKKKAEGEKM